LSEALPMNSGLVDHIRDLAATGGLALRFRRMFGGYGVYRDERMIGLIADEVLYLKADAALEPLFVAAGSIPFTYTGKSKPVQMSYWRCPESGLDDPEQFGRWLDHATAAALRSARTSASRKAKRQSPGTQSN
jgi:DNA transformation protein